MSDSVSFGENNNDSDDSTTLGGDEFASGALGKFKAVNNKLEE